MNYLLLSLLALCFGPTFLFNKVAVLEMPVVQVVSIRIVLSAVLLLPILRLRGERLPPFGPIWFHLGMMSLLATLIPFFCFTWGAWHIDVSLGGLVNGATPFFTLILAHLFLPGESISSEKLSGTLIGMLGLVILFLPGLIAGASGELLGGLAVLAAALSNSASYVYARRFLRGSFPLINTSAQLIIASAVCLPIYLVFSPKAHVSASWAAWAAASANAITGTVLAFWIFYSLVERSSATFVSLVTYLLPPIGVLLGVLVMGEIFQPHFFFSLIFILSGMFIAGRVKKKWTPKTA